MTAPMESPSISGRRLSRFACAGALAFVVFCFAAAGARAAAENDCNSDAPDRMIAGCTEILKTASDPAVKAAAFARRGFAHKQRNECEPAIADFTDALRVTANNVAILLLRGECFAAANRPNDAAADFQAALKIDPQNKEAAAAIDRLRPQTAAAKGAPAGAAPTANAPGNPPASASEAALAPAKPASSAPATAAATADLSGLWTTQDGRVIQITQNGNRVTSHSCCRAGHEFWVASVSATLEGHTLVGTYRYQEGNSSGVGTINYTLDGNRLEGAWTAPNGQSQNSVLTRLPVAGASEAAVPASAAGPRPTGAPAAAPPPAASSEGFDGTWSVTQVCPPTGSTLGYTTVLTVQIAGGAFQAEQGVQGQPGWMSYAGKVAEDGVVTIKATGLLGANRAYNASNAPPGTPFGFEVEGRLTGTTGTGKRKSARACDWGFVKQ